MGAALVCVHTHETIRNKILIHYKINYYQPYNLILKEFEIWGDIRPSHLEPIVKKKTYLSPNPVVLLIALSIIH